MKILIDCGANRGQSVEQFRKLFPADHTEFVIYCFEPHIEAAAKIDLAPNHGAVFAKAAGTADGRVDFFPGPSTLGSTLYGDKITGSISSEPVKVPAVDLSQFLKDKSRPDDYVVLKLNVEGAEYPILRRMLVDGTLALIDRLYVAWHHAKIPSINEATHEQLVAEIEQTGLVCEDWWGRK